jgi:hypothetical protein
MGERVSESKTERERETMGKWETDRESEIESNKERNREK